MDLVCLVERPGTRIPFKKVSNEGFNQVYQNSGQSSTVHCVGVGSYQENAKCTEGSKRRSRKGGNNHKRPNIMRGFVLLLALQVNALLRGYPLSWVQYLWLQSYHETGGFTSRLCRKYNNYFGMKHPSRRPTKSRYPTEAAEGEFAVFFSVWQSVKDQFMYLDYFNYKQEIQNIKNSRDFARTLKNKGYYTDSFENYYTGMDLSKKKYEAVVKLEIIMGFMIFSFALLFWLKPFKKLFKKQTK